MSSEISAPSIHRAYATAFATAFLVTLFIIRTDPGVFKRFLGSVDAVFALLITGILGQICLWYLVRRHNLSVSIKLHIRNILPVLSGSVLFGTVVILIDHTMPLPADINIAFPISLLFYPVIGLLAEILFHVIPLTLFSGALSLWSKGLSGKKILLISILLTALAEPVYQVYFMHSSGDNPAVLIVLIGLHVLFISLFQLFLFIRQGFFHMYLFRLCYYFIWHVIWGALRLHFL